MPYNMYFFTSPTDEEPVAVLFDDSKKALLYAVERSAGTSDIIRVMDMDTSEWITLNELRRRTPGWPYVREEPLHNYWYRFAAHNEQARYGFGTPEEAEEYCDILSEGREINLFQAYRLKDNEGFNLRLSQNSEAFDLDDALATHKGLR